VILLQIIESRGVEITNKRFLSMKLNLKLVTFVACFSIRMGPKNGQSIAIAGKGNKPQEQFPLHRFRSWSAVGAVV